MDSMNALVPKTAVITILGKERTLKPMTLSQAVRLGRLAGELSTALPAGASDAEFLSAIISLAGGERAGEVLETLLGAQLTAQEKSQTGDISIEELSELARALGAVNDFRRVFANFRTALEAMNPRQTRFPAP